MTAYGVADHIRFEHRGRGGPLGRGHARAGRSRCAAADGADRDHRRRRGHQRGGPAQPAQAPRHPRARHLRGPGHALGPVGRRHRPRRQAGRGDRHRRQRVPDRAHHRRRGRARSPCSSGRRRGCSPTRTTTTRSATGVQWALRAPALLRPLVPVPAVLAGVRRRPAGHDASTRTGPTRTGPSARSTTPPARCSPSTWPTRSATTPSCWPRSCPTTCASGKRTLQDNGSWLAALHARRRRAGRPTRSPRSAPTGSCAPSGAEHAVDVIVYATGFHANRYLWPMEIVGPRRRRCWPSSGATSPPPTSASPCPTSPTCSASTGPGTNLAHGGSLIFHSECQIRYVMGCLAAAARPPGAPAIECRQDVHDDYNERLQAELDTMVWSHPSIRHSWYRNADGAHLHPVAVAARRLLDVDARARPRRLRAHLAQLAGCPGVAARDGCRPQAGEYRPAMTETEKPSVYVPPGEAPPAELVIEDLVVGDGDEAIPGPRRRGPLRRGGVEHAPAVRRLVGPQRHVLASGSARARSSPAGTRAWPA